LKKEKDEKQIQKPQGAERTIGRGDFPSEGGGGYEENRYLKRGGIRKGKISKKRREAKKPGRRGEDVAISKRLVQILEKKAREKNTNLREVARKK